MTRPPVDPSLAQARLLSSGTMATLTGVTRYHDLDLIRDNFIAWITAQPSRYAHWMAAWDAFAKEVAL